MCLYNYSIIIPHKNIPDLLQRCLDNIPKRDDVQIIIVDDNSDPKIVDFEHFPGLDCSNTEVYFDKTTRGAGRARNVGLEYAKGEWVLFADADDMFEEGINTILNQVMNRDEDVIYFDVVSKDSDTLEITEESIGFTSTLHSEDDFSLRFGLSTPWMKAIRLSLIKEHKISFDETPVGNDIWFSSMCGLYAKKVGTIPVVGYCWMRRNASLWRSNKDLIWYKTRFEVVTRIAMFMKKQKNERAFKAFALHSTSFIGPMEKLSVKDYMKAELYYGWMVRDYRILIVWAPLYVFRRLKRVVGINFGMVGN